MKGIIIIKDGNDVCKVLNIHGYIEMRTKILFDNIKCRLVGADNRTVLFQVRTTQKRWNELKSELDTLYPGSCIYLEPKKQES